MKQIEIKTSETVSKNNGVLLASVTRGMKKGGFFNKIFTTKDVYAWFYFNKVSSSKENSKRMESNRYKFIGRDNELKQYNDDGRVVAFELEPGEYEITSWTLYDTGHGPPPHNYKYIKSKHFEPKKFIVKPGKVSYIGELHLEAVYGKNFLGISIVAGAKSSCTNESKRDISIFKEKYPTLNDWPIEFSVIDC